MRHLTRAGQVTNIPSFADDRLQGLKGRLSDLEPLPKPVGKTEKDSMGIGSGQSQWIPVELAKEESKVEGERQRSPVGILSLRFGAWELAVS